jgi:hypothetical protein
LKLFHGTHSSSLPAIRREGLRPACLAATFELAMAYAEAAADEDGLSEGEPVVLEVEVEETHLRIDFPSLEEPCGYGGISSGVLERLVRRMWARETRLHPDWVCDGFIILPPERYDLSLNTVGTARCSVFVPWSGLRVVG